MANVEAFQAILLDEILGAGANNVAPATWHFALSTTVPAADGSGANEPSGGAYARVAATNNGSNFGPSTTSAPIQLQNNTNVTFPRATASWGTIVAVLIYDAASAGQLRMFAQLDSNHPVNSGNVLEFNPASLTWS